MKKGHKLMIILALCLGMTAVSAAGAPAAEKSIVVGGKNFTEQYLLPELAKFLLEKAGFKVTLKTGVGTAIARKSLVNDQIDMYYEYTGTAYTVFYKQDDSAVMSNPKEVYDWVKGKDSKKDLVWLKPVKFNNTYTIMMRKEEAKKRGITSLSDFANHIKKKPEDLIMALGAEFWERPDGFKKLMKVYDFTMPVSQVKKMQMGLTYMALKNNQVGAAMGFATDGRIAAFGLLTLVDDKHFFPVYNPAPVIRAEVLKKYPEISGILAPLADKLTTEKMQKLNMLVDVKHKNVSKVSKQFLQEEGLL